MQPGRYELGAALGHGPVIAAPPLDLLADQALVARYSSRRAWRIAGLATLGAGLLAGLIITPSISGCGASDTQPGDAQPSGCKSGPGRFGPGIIVAVVAALLALPMLLQKDHVTFVPDDQF